MPQPNIVVIMTDQQRADLCAREGFPLDTTPFLDRLAREGTWFSRAHSSAPLCAPARVSLLTGRWPSAHDVRVNHHCHHARYDKDIVDVCREQGYATAMVGKNHSHLTADRVDHWFALSHNAGQGQPNRSDQEMAFDQYLAEMNHRVALEPTPFPVECQGPHRAVSDATQWIDSLGAQPFFLWLTFAEPHNPYQVPEPYYSLFPPESLPPTRATAADLAAKGFKWEFLHLLGQHVYPNYDDLVARGRANYCGMLRLLDDQVKRFVEFLDAQGLRDNTLIVFVSDHGDFVGEYGLMRKGPEIPELLIRIPLLFHGPGVVAEAEPHGAHVSICDIMPTLCEAIGAPMPAGVQGRSLWPLLTGGDYPAEEFASVVAEQGFGGLHYTWDDDPDFDHCLIPGPQGPTFDCLNSYTQSGVMRSLRKGDWKLLFDMQGRGQLYDLASDPVELHNLFDDRHRRPLSLAAAEGCSSTPGAAGPPPGIPPTAGVADVQADLLADLLAWTLRMQDPLPSPLDKYVPKTAPHNYWAPCR